MSNFHPAPDGLVAHFGLMCYVDRLEYDPRSRIGKLYLTDGCCDMTGAVALFEAIDDRVKRIETYSAGLPDTVYSRKNRKPWQAFDAFPVERP